MRVIKVTLGAVFAAVLCGCAGKPAIITQTEFKEVYVPVACIEKMPAKPVYDGSAQSAKELMGYFKRCEELLKGCVAGRISQPRGATATNRRENDERD